MTSVIDCMKGSRFQWTNEVEDAFQLIKVHLTSTPILVLPDFANPFELHYDASKVGIGAVLIQHGRSVTYFSEKFLGSRIR